MQSYTQSNCSSIYPIKGNPSDHLYHQLFDKRSERFSNLLSPKMLLDQSQVFDHSQSIQVPLNKKKLDSTNHQILEAQNNILESANERG
jgi:hypothetical protein